MTTLNRGKSPSEKENEMSFNFDSFMTAMSQMLPAVGQAVTVLHPGAEQEAMKIQMGVAMVQALVSIIHQSTASAPATPPAP